jgi:hypothetical protein
MEIHLFPLLEAKLTADRVAKNREEYCVGKAHQYLDRLRPEKPSRLSEKLKNLGNAAAEYKLLGKARSVREISNKVLSGRG